MIFSVERDSVTDGFRFLINIREGVFVNTVTVALLAVE
jgi:hypothetical protein